MHNFNGDAGLILDAGLEGATRKNDNELAYLRVYVEYDFNPVWMIFANSLQAVYPDLSKFDALDIAIHEMNDYNGDGLYAVRGDIAFRIIPVKQGEGENEVTYIIVEFVPKSAISESQIGHVVEISESETVSSDAAATGATDTVTTDTSASVSEPAS